ncbi:MAG: hypothetical protein K0U68_13250 [Gammaproteobacteria bacterium]|nr:hypothetical protein [Gammaproteobacteria bacterium]
MKIINVIVLTLSLGFSSHLLADESTHMATTSDYVLDLALRPLGLISTIVGSGLYVGLSPLTLVSHAFPPHESFQKLGNFMVVTPAKFTFERPVGDYTIHSGY